MSYHDAAYWHDCQDGQYVESLLVDVEAVGLISQNKETQKQDDCCGYDEGCNSRDTFSELCESSHKSFMFC